MWLRDELRVPRQINRLITDISRNGSEGTGKPEALKFGLSGYWWKRIIAPAWVQTSRHEDPNRNRYHGGHEPIRC